MATQLDPTWYTAWHTWALANFDVINFLETRNESRMDDLPSRSLATYVVAAIQGAQAYYCTSRSFHSQASLGFFRSIALRTENSLQDTLRLITLWFKFGGHEDVCAAIADGFLTVSIDTWLEVIPQVRLFLVHPFFIPRVSQFLPSPLDYCENPNPYPRYPTTD